VPAPTPTTKHLTNSTAVTLWDTAGQERFRTLTSSFYRGAQGILLVYDVTRPETFHHLETWLEEVDHFCVGGGATVAKLLVGNKADLEDQRAVTFADGEAWARSKGMMFLETSAKTRAGIQQAFEEVLEKILETPALLAGTAPPTRRTEEVDMDEEDIEEPKGTCCS
jgi:Ras-related protein Rab-18